MSKREIYFNNHHAEARRKIGTVFYIDTAFLFICIFLMLFAYSCIETEETEKIEVINQTNEAVIIEYLGYFNSKISLATIARDDTQFIYVTPGTTYYARGKSSNKDYGERKFVKVPSYVDVQQTWVIRE